MDTFQMIYIAFCFVMAMQDHSNLYRKIPYPKLAVETVIVALIISWPIWFFPVAVYVSASKRNR